MKYLIKNICDVFLNSRMFKNEFGLVRMNLFNFASGKNRNKNHYASGKFS
jgi:hypothetical protein